MSSFCIGIRLRRWGHIHDPIKLLFVGGGEGGGGGKYRERRVETTPLMQLTSAEFSRSLLDTVLTVNSSFSCVGKSASRTSASTKIRERTESDECRINRFTLKQYLVRETT
jgi:hypothetical protein